MLQLLEVTEYRKEKMLVLSELEPWYPGHKSEQFNQNLEEVVKPRYQHFVKVPGDSNEHPRLRTNGLETWLQAPGWDFQVGRIHRGDRSVSSSLLISNSPIPFPPTLSPALPSSPKGTLLGVSWWEKFLLFQTLAQVSGVLQQYTEGPEIETPDLNSHWCLPEI